MYCYATQSKTCFVYALRHVLFCSFIFYDIIGLQVSKPIHNVITYKDCWRCKYLGIRKKIELIFPVHRWMHFFVIYKYHIVLIFYILHSFSIHFIYIQMDWMAKLYLILRYDSAIEKCSQRCIRGVYDSPTVQTDMLWFNIMIKLRYHSYTNCNNG